MKAKTQIKVNSNLFSRYAQVCAKDKQDPYFQLEKCMREYIATTLIFDPKLNYRLRIDEEVDAVTIVERIDNFILLSNRNQIHVLDFEKLYEALDPGVNKVLKELEELESVVHCDLTTMSGEAVDPIDFLYGSTRVAESIVNHIKTQVEINDDSKPHGQTKVYHVHADGSREEMGEKWRSQYQTAGTKVLVNGKRMYDSEDAPNIFPYEINFPHENI